MSAAIFLLQNEPQRTLGDAVQMAHFNPDFWEIPVDFDKLAEFDTSYALGYETDEEQESRWMREDIQEQFMPELMEIIENELTPKQRQAFMLYFLGQKTQEEIGRIMGIPHQVVSQHIYGIKRGSKKIGGAIAKIRKACEERGIAINHRKNEERPATTARASMYQRDEAP